MSEDDNIKEQIRELLLLWDGNIDNMNPSLLCFYPADEQREDISRIRWFVSHGYFRKNDPKPEDFSDCASSPPMTHVYSQLYHGAQMDMAKDLGLCVQPVIQNSVDAEHAMRRMRQRVISALYGYVTDEDARKNREEPRLRQQKERDDLVRRKKHAEDMAARRLTERKAQTWDPEEYLKKKNKDRAEAKKKREQAEKESLRRFNEETERLKRSGIKT
jgi:hypothetical protein